MEQFQSAADYLAFNGLDLNSLLATGTPKQTRSEGTGLRMSTIVRARLPRTPADSLWNVSVLDDRVVSVTAYHHSGPDFRRFQGAVDAHGRLLAPALCHAHVHLDKCFLLHDPKYNDLEITEGTFAEAMSLTGEAKKRFAEEDLLRRGRRLILESIQSGVTSMRAFVEVDEVAETKCLDAALKLQEEFRKRCQIQICAFAQLALFSSEHAPRRRHLLEQALQNPHVDVVGSTPYVEDDASKSKQCIEYTIQLALATSKHLDFHLDYNLDRSLSPLVHTAIEQLKIQQWSEKAHGRTVCFGHCTRLTLFTDKEFKQLASDIGQLPVSFIGLPTSDLFIQGRTDQGSRPRATLPIPDMIHSYQLQGAVSINNIGNAFTPHGSCDPLLLASMGVGLYHAGTKRDTETLYVSPDCNRTGRLLTCFLPGMRLEPSCGGDWPSDCDARCDTWATRESVALRRSDRRRPSRWRASALAARVLSFGRCPYSVERLHLALL